MSDAAASSAPRETLVPFSAAAVVAAGRTLYGSEWVRKLSADWPFDERSLRRVAKIAREEPGGTWLFKPSALRALAALVNEAVTVSDLEPLRPYGLT